MSLRWHMFRVWVVIMSVPAAFAGSTAPSTPAILPPSTNTPAGIAPDDFPQIVLLTFDDAIYPERYDVVQPLLTGVSNPNGSPVRATFFINTDFNDYFHTHLLWADGHEIGVHTMSHNTAVSNGIDRVRWRREIIGARSLLARYAGIPAHHIRGFRAPYLQYQPEMFQVLEDEGFLYDASIAEYINATSVSKTVGARIFPYTLDGSFPQRIIPPSIAPTGSYALIEVPIYPLYDGGRAVVLTDSLLITNHTEFATALESTFQQHYDGNRAPMTICLHPKNLLEMPERIPVLTNFMAWAAGHSNTWFITTTEAAEFMLNPAAAGEVLSNGVFAAPSRASASSNLFTECAGMSPGLTVLGECPDYYPLWNNTGLQIVDEQIDAYATYMYTAENASNLVAYAFVVSNSTPYDPVSWSLRFDLSGGSNRAVFGSSGLTQLGPETWEAEAKPYLFDLPPGYVETNMHVFFEQTNDTVVITNVVVTLRTLQRAAPEIIAVAHDAPGSLRMTWSQSGFDYTVKGASSLALQDWNVLAQEVATNTYTVNSPGTAFYAIEANP